MILDFRCAVCNEYLLGGYKSEEFAEGTKLAFRVHPCSCQKGVGPIAPDELNKLREENGKLKRIIQDSKEIIEKQRHDTCKAIAGGKCLLFPEVSVENFRKLSVENSELKGTIKELEGRIEKSFNENEKLKSDVVYLNARVRYLDQVNGALRHQSRTTRYKNNWLRKELEELKEQREKKQSCVIINEMLECEKRNSFRLMNEIIGLKKENTALRTTIPDDSLFIRSENERLNIERKELKLRIENQCSEIIDLQEKSGDLEALNVKQEKIIDDLKRLKFYNPERFDMDLGSALGLKGLELWGSLRTELLYKVRMLVKELIEEKAKNEKVKSIFGMKS
jgi:hypothetical protein